MSLKATLTGDNREHIIGKAIQIGHDYYGNDQQVEVTITEVWPIYSPTFANPDSTVGFFADVEISSGHPRPF